MNAKLTAALIYAGWLEKWIREALSARLVVGLLTGDVLFGGYCLACEQQGMMCEKHRPKVQPSRGLPQFLPAAWPRRSS